MLCSKGGISEARHREGTLMTGVWVVCPATSFPSEACFLPGVWKAASFTSHLGFHICPGFKGDPEASSFS